MKKLIATIFIISLTLTACADEETAKKVENPGEIKCSFVGKDFEQDYILKNEDEMLVSYVNITRTNFDAIGYDEESIMGLGKIYESNTQLAGVTYEYEVVDEFFIETLSVNYSEADIEELKSNGLTGNLNEESTEDNDIETSIAELEERGFSCER